MDELTAAAVAEGWSSDELFRPLSSTSCFTCARSSLLVSSVCVITPSVVIGCERVACSAPMSSSPAPVSSSGSSPSSLALIHFFFLL